VQQWPLPVKAGYCLYSLCSKCTEICLDLCDQKVSGACEVYRVERGAVLCWTARGSTVSFTLGRMLTGPRKCLDTKGKKISAAHQGTNTYTGWTVLHICSLSADKEIIIGQAHRYTPVAIKPAYLSMPHAVKFPLNTMRAGFEPKPFRVGFLVDKVAMGHILLRKFRFTQ